jgi:splicing factor U2AF subunit
MELGDKHLKVQRASIGVTQASGLEMGVNAMSMLAGTTSTDLEEGRVLQLLNMVTAEELIDNQEYEGLLKSISYHSRRESQAATLTKPFLRNLRGHQRGV